MRRELGPNAAVLHTRAVRGRWLGFLPGPQQIEVTASREINVPSRLQRHVRDKRQPAESPSQAQSESLHRAAAAASEPQSSRCVRSQTSASHLSRQMQGQLSTLQSMVKDLCLRSKGNGHGDWPEEFFSLFTELLDADINEDIARELVERTRSEPHIDEICDPVMLKAHVVGLMEEDIQISGPIRITPGRCRLAALVGPTGVGKTTTIAKLAANFRLKEKCRVGLITVDTYRIAAVEQLRTYADIIDLPMHVVSTPRDMRETVDRMSHLDLILLDTAGRSPKDEVRIQELKVFLNEAGADDVHLVLSSVAGARTLQHTVEQFGVVGPTSLILTKLDEADGVGNLLPLLRNGGLPLSYLTDGQNVPDDIAVANAHRLAKMMLPYD